MLFCSGAEKKSIKKSYKINLRFSLNLNLNKKPATTKTKNKNPHTYNRNRFAEFPRKLSGIAFKRLLLRRL